MKPGADLHETTLNGPKTRRWVVEARECAEMSTHRIARLGMDEALPPYRRVRMKPEGSFVLACVSGEGAILLDGRWQRVKPGMVCLAPPRVLNAFEAKGRERWCFAWVRYDEPSFVVPVVGAASPVIPTAQADEIVRIITGLRAEWEGEKEPRMLHHWLELLHGTIRRIAQPWRRKEPRVARLWAAVEQDLQRDWTLAELAHRSHCSPEHLRRLCLKELGRSPMQHLTCLRMELARRLLEQGSDKLEVVAGSVGYAHAAIFSRVFKRWVGVSPSDYRGREDGNGPCRRRGCRADAGHLEQSSLMRYASRDPGPARTAAQAQRASHDQTLRYRASYFGLSRARRPFSTMSPMRQ